MFADSPWVVLIVLLLTLVLFIWGKWRFDVVALCALGACVLLGVVPVDGVYTGLSNPAVITVACVMVISQAITYSGILTKWVSRFSHINSSFLGQMAVLCFLAAFLSAFMNNVGALALLMPIAIKSAQLQKRSPSLFLMPLALASALGGLTTLMGTPPNLLISSYMQQQTGKGFSVFAFGHVGIFIAAIGLVCIIFVLWRFIPSRCRDTLAEPELFKIEGYITELRIGSESSMVGKSIREFEQTIESMNVVGIIRDHEKVFLLSGSTALHADDIVIISAAGRHLEDVLAIKGISLVEQEHVDQELLKAHDISVVEAVVPPSSPIEGRNWLAMRMRSRYRLSLIALARAGTVFKERIHRVNLEPGDVLLLQGKTDVINDILSQVGLLPLVERPLNIAPSPRAWFPLLFFAIAIAVAVMGWFPVDVSFGGAVIAMVLTRSMPLRLLYTSISWPIILLLAAFLPVGQALQSSGGGAWIASLVLLLHGHLSGVMILGIILIITMTLSDFMNNAATTVVMAPISIDVAHAIGAHIAPFLMAVAIGASCSFLTPIGHQNNTLVMGPGGYHFGDYFRVGILLEILIILIAVPLLAWMWPLY